MANDGGEPSGGGKMELWFLLKGKRGAMNVHISGTARVADLKREIRTTYSNSLTCVDAGDLDVYISEQAMIGGQQARSCLSLRCQPMCINELLTLSIVCTCCRHSAQRALPFVTLCSSIFCNPWHGDPR
jgi:hypothetical protein